VKRKEKKREKKKVKMMMIAMSLDEGSGQQGPGAKMARTQRYSGAWICVASIHYPLPISGFGVLVQ
jgi:hypothetical protein